MEKRMENVHDLIFSVAFSLVLRCLSVALSTFIMPVCRVRPYL